MKLYLPARTASVFRETIGRIISCRLTTEGDVMKIAISGLGRMGGQIAKFLMMVTTWSLITVRQVKLMKLEHGVRQQHTTSKSVVDAFADQPVALLNLWSLLM